MVFMCVICMINEPPLLALSADHRQLLEAIVSPVINTTELKAFKLLHCVYCKKLLESVYNFQQTALRGVKTFKYLLKKHDGPTAAQSRAFKPKPETKPKMVIKDEPEIELEHNQGIVTVVTTEEINPLSEERVIKIEPFPKSEPVSDCDSVSTISCDSCEILDPEGSVAAAGTSAASEMKPTGIQPNTKASQVRVFSKKPKQKSQKSKVVPIPQAAQKVKTPKVASVKTKIVPPTKLTSTAVATNAKVCLKEDNFDVFTHKTQDFQSGQSSLWTPTHASMSEESRSLMLQEAQLAKQLPYLTSIRWKNGVEEGYIKRERKKPEKVSCPVCNKVLSSKPCLKTHLSVHGEATPAECKTCGKVCNSEKALKVHMIKHKMEIKSVDDINPELFCQQCAMHFPCRSTYKTHMKALKHTPKEQFTFECDTCKKKFPSEERRQGHIDIVHLHKKQHKCDICGKSYGKRNSLRAHVARVHDQLPKPKPRPHICHVCGKAFTGTKSLQEHLLSHQGLRPYQCKLCPATFSYSAALYTHNKLKHLKIKGNWKKKGKKRVEESGEGRETGEMGKDSGEVGKELGEVGKDSREVEKELGVLGKESREVEKELGEVEKESGDVVMEVQSLDIDSFLN